MRQASSFQAAVLLVAVALQGSGPQAGPARAGAPANLNAGARMTNVIDGAEMVRVPGGTFRMGARDNDRWAEPVELPVHTVRLTRPYWVYRTEVTNEQYARFLIANPQHRKPLFWNNPKFNAPAQPVVGVSWDDARDYCRWAGVRLLTEAEWEFAARGSTGRLYPWGDAEPDARRAIFNGETVPEHPAPVGSVTAGESPFGVLDMAGNVWEWCADRWGKYAPDAQSNPTGPESGRERVLRGGAWSRYAEHLRATARYHYVPDMRCHPVGFRASRN